MLLYKTTWRGAALCGVLGFMGRLIFLAPVAAAEPHAIVPALERYYAENVDETGDAGTVLLGELNCTACHAPSEAAATRIDRKQPPILDGVGARLRVEYLQAFLAEPSKVKPGTTMPHALASVMEKDRPAAVEALVHFLASTGSMLESAVRPQSVEAGQKLYHTIGCVACHGTRDKQAQAFDQQLADSQPLGELAAKYSIPGLSAFLLQPHAVRPAGRMPSLNLSAEEARDIANYLLQSVTYAAEPVLKYDYYEADFGSALGLDTQRPKTSGQTATFDMSLAERDDNFALRFRGYYHAGAPGDYTFHVTSDDGSRLWIDGKEVVDNDGIHAPSTKSALIKLDAGPHEFVAAMFNGGGGSELQIEFEGPGLTRQSVLPALSVERERPRPKAAENVFALDATLVARGGELFASVGCASCHQLNQNGQLLKSSLKAPALADLRPGLGCLSGKGAVAGQPRYELTSVQRKSIAAGLALANKPAAIGAEPGRVVHRAMLTFNCYACHQRGAWGGVDEARGAMFETTQKEMGDEGRLPPLLNGVGAKLRPQWFNHLWAESSKDRPYMLTRMPRFGQENVGQLTTAFAAEDKDLVALVAAVTFGLAEPKVKSEGRHLVGAKSLGCIKCHNFRDVRSTGIGAIDLTTSSQRLNRDWFHRYVVDPQAFRPGTRMPSAWPGGKSLLKQSLDGDPAKQIEAIWLYLADGDSAAIPLGMGRDPIELAPTNRAIIYRNFIQDAGPRAIAVGYPEHANLAFDANDLRLALVWQGAFIDASRHWVDRGAGTQGPLGDNVVKLVAGPPIAMLSDIKQPWPAKNSRELGYKFRGYRLTKDGRPTFLYECGPIQTADFFTAQETEGRPTLTRALEFTAAGDAPANAYFRLARAGKIESQGAVFRIDDTWTMQIAGDAKPIVREESGQQELLAPLDFKNGKASLGITLSW